MFPQIFPIVAAFAKEKGVGLRIDRDEVRKGELELHGAQSTQGFDSRFYGESITEALFLSTLDSAIERGDSSLEIMCQQCVINKRRMTHNLQRAIATFNSAI